MERFVRSSLLLLLAASVTACSGGGQNLTPPVSGPPPAAGVSSSADQSAPLRSDSMMTQSASAQTASPAPSGSPASTQVTIQGPVTSTSTTPYFHVVANIAGKGNVSIYSSYLAKAQVGNVVNAVGFYNSLGNFQASSASIVSASSATSQITIQGTVTSVSNTANPYVVANIPNQGSTSIYTTYLRSAQVGNVVKAIGYYNVLGNFAASSASIVSTSTPAPTSSPTTKPAATSAPSVTTPVTASASGSGVAGKISQFQIFDYSTTASQSTAAAANMTAVWGAGTGNKGANPKTWLAGNAQVSTIQYFVQPTDENPISGHNLAWFQANHPDWIVYDCDANNQPTHTVAYQPGLPNDVPLDIHNPAVIQYQIQTVANFAIAHGANAIGADQTLFFDYDGNQASGYYGCGIYQNGTFVRRWGAAKGGFPNYDPQWNHDVAAWVATAKQILTTNSTYAAHNLKLYVNHPAGSITNSDEQKLIANVDGLVDETGFVDYGNYPKVPSLFPTALAYMEYVQHQGKTILETAKFSGSLNGDSTDYGLTVSQVDYAMSSYLIGNEGHASLFITPGPYGAVYNFPQIATVNAQLGTSCGSYSTVGAAYVRKFQHGMVVVNPSTATVAVPLGGAYHDVMGRSISGTSLSVGSADGYVLLGAGGC